MRTLVFACISALSFYGCTPKVSPSASSGGSVAIVDTTAIAQTTNSPSKELKAARRGEVLFLGNESKHHDANKYAPWLAISLFKAGINLTYTQDLNDLNTANLQKYDGLVIYANHDSISNSQEQALRSFVESGKGLIPLHSAAGCFKNSDWYVNTIGGQFKSHGVDTFTAVVVNRNHPVTKDVLEFNTWDETYVHQRLDPKNVVLMERVSGANREPYTWVRNVGKGRVFYTAYGHNDSTWTNAGFFKLVSNGVLWAIGDEVQDQIARLNRPDIEIYTPSIMANFAKRHHVPKMQNALSPEESLKHTQVPVDFKVELFAAEPDITNPIAMSWDEKGRLWIVESVDYPNTFAETDGESNDRIKICEDTDGDGKADKFTIFADSLNIPTSMVFANGGVVVSMAPYFLYLKDTDGDDKADVREVVMKGWDKGDTHFGPSNLQYGFDNRVWGVVGSGFNGTTKDGKTHNFRTGVWNMNPDGTGLQFLANTSNNTWGLGFSEDNNVFISTANNTHSAFFSFPAKFMQRNLPSASADGNAPVTNVQPVQKIDGHYEVHAMTPNLRQVDVVGGFTSAAGHHMYTARNYPKEYWNRVAFVCEPTVRLLHNAIIEPKGAGFTERDGWNLMASSDEWFGPVHAEVGPDGAVWVSDWYNFIIQHNVFVEQQAPSEMVLPFKEQPRGQGNAFISPMRDINHGRVYRVIYKNAKPQNKMSLSRSDLPGLIAALKNDNMFWRMHAQRLIVESKNMQAVPGLLEIVANQQVDEIGLNSPAVHALWTLHGLGAISRTNQQVMQAVVKALSHPAAGVRKAAVQVLPQTDEAVSAIAAGNLLKDPNLNTRMAALIALAEMPASEKIGELVYAATLDPENGSDEWISKALFAAAITHQDGYLAAARKAPAASPELKDSRITEKIALALGKEVYNLPRRGNLLFPPDVSNKEIIISGTVNKGQRDLEGVVVAQGGPNAGYAVFIQNGKLNMVVKQNGKTYQATSTGTLPEKFDLVARISSGGAMTLEVDGKVVGRSKAPALFSKPLQEALRVSYDYDNENRIGKYEGSYPLRGNFQNGEIELKRPVKTAATVKKESSTAQAKPAALKPVTINVRVKMHVMKFDKELITVKAGQKVTINLDNPDIMQHNMVIVKPGTMQKVGLAADELARDPKGAEKQYVPRMPEVLHFTRLLNPDEEATMTFTAPSTPGDYPYICTFPGHWRIMNGIMRVIK